MSALLGQLTAGAAPSRWARRGRLAAPLLAVLLAALAWALVVTRSNSGRGVPAVVAPGIPGRVDVGFSQAMVEHHLQAVTMSQILLLGHGASPEVRALASNIETTQLQEIGTMQGWLALWSAPPIASGSPMQWMAGGAPIGQCLATGTMPGLATQRELDALQRASGRRLDVMFLALMLRHHEGGVEMALYAAAYARLAPVRAFAQNIVLDQDQEITLMEALLQRDGGQPLPFGGPTTSAALNADLQAPELARAGF